VIYVIRQRCPEVNIAAREVIDIVTAPCAALIADEWIKHAPEGSFFWVVGLLGRYLGPDGSFQPKTGSEFFGAITEVFRHLESYKATPGDYAIQALQNAFVGLMQNNYAWGKGGLPTKSEVTTMAKKFLEKEQKPAPKGGWTKLRSDARLGFLPSKRAGRPPSERKVDEILKAKQEALSNTTKLVNEQWGGDWQRLNDIIKIARGGKKSALQSELDRLNEQYGQPQLPNDEDGESE
jgi:hypothetical protein